MTGPRVGVSWLNSSWWHCLPSLQVLTLQKPMLRLLTIGTRSIHHSTMDEFAVQSPPLFLESLVPTATPGYFHMKRHHGED